jgi:hypothetical protein
MSQAETEQIFLIGQQWNGLYRDRYAYDRQTLLENALFAWRLNPLARRLANLYKMYNVDGVEFHCDHVPTQTFLKEFWNHDLNQMDDMLEEISNELFLTGNLFPLFSVDGSGMTYVRIFPTDQIDEIITADNDIRQETMYTTKTMGDLAARSFVNPRGLVSSLTPKFMEHYVINKLAGVVWGEGEIWSDLPWLGRYATWLEDRVRLNHFRNAFMYDVQGDFKNEEERKKREREINANPPRPGTVNVHGLNEIWGILSPTLDAFDASMDGMAIKKMVAVNHVPMHYLAEGESSTRTTSDAAGTPSFKAFENHQKIFLKIVKKILEIARARRAEKDSAISKDALIEVTAADATERDNAGLALATGQIVAAIGELFDRELIDEREYLRLVYRFSGESMSADTVVPKGKRRPIVQPGRPAPQGGLKTDAATGEVQTPKSAG